MVEKNYDPDNENCPEKDTIENLYAKTLSEKNKNTQTVEEFIDDNPNRISKKDNLNPNDSD
ncbi:hypothetical protein [Flavobacterium fluviatile]|uniref:hypothetical protein n=1 Tax=Flavobacterium fluviatile TaxID=1862387 RepID=UPI0013D6D32F|nr:hypothetical protein [Flavobacterium fluviatile]